MAVTYTRTYNTSLWPRCYSSVSTAAATDCLSESAAAIKGYTYLTVYPDSNQRILTSTCLHAGFQGQPLEMYNAHTSFTLLVFSENFGGAASSGIKIPGYNQLVIGPLQTAKFSYTGIYWLYDGNAVLSTPALYASNTTGTQAAASQINVANAVVNVVLNTSAAIKVPPATGSGSKVAIYNATASTVGVYPATGQNFGTSAANVSTSLLASTSIRLWDAVATTWAII